MKNYILSIILLLIVWQCKSQNILDSISNGSVISVGGSSFAVYDKPTVVGIAEDYATCETCMQLKDTLISIVHIQQQRITVKDSIISLIKEQNFNKDAIITAYQYKDLNDKNYISSLNLELKQSKTRTWVFGGIGGTLALGLFIGLIYSVAH